MRTIFGRVKSWHWLGLIMVVLTVAAIIMLLSRDQLAYRQDPDVVVVYADILSWPSGPLPGQACNQIPALRIWGDGRIVFVQAVGGVRRVMVGTLTADELSGLLGMLEEMDYYDNPPPDLINEAGTGYILQVNLKWRQVHSFWATENDVFRAVIEAIEVEALELFTPETGLLTVGPYAGMNLEAYPEWPQDFPFSLAEVGAEGRWVEGDILTYAWEKINQHRLPLTGVEENGTVYAIGLEITGISLQDPPYDCWDGYR
jgi:hypothetical protein